MKETLKTKTGCVDMKRFRALKYCKQGLLALMTLAGDTEWITTDDIHAVSRIWYEMVRQSGEDFCGLTTDPNYNPSKRYTHDHYWKPQRAAEWILECLSVDNKHRKYIIEQPGERDKEIREGTFELSEETHKYMTDFFDLFFDMRKIIKTTKEINLKLRQHTKDELTKDTYKALNIKLYDVNGNEVDNELKIPEVYTNWERTYLKRDRKQRLTRLEDLLKDTLVGQIIKKELMANRGVLDV